MNDYTKMPDGVLHGKVEEASTVLIEQYADYGLTEVEIEILGDTNSEFGTDISLATTLENDRKAAVATKNSKRAELISAMSTVAKKIYANPAVDDAMLAKIGLSPRPVYGTRTTPKTPTNLTATTSGDGVVVLKWSRNGNSSSAQFTVWSKGSTGDWTSLASTNKLKITLDSPAGVFKMFRVTSTVNNQTSLPSDQVSIYGSGSSSTTLSIAA